MTTTRLPERAIEKTLVGTAVPLGPDIDMAIFAAVLAGMHECLASLTGDGGKEMGLCGNPRAEIEWVLVTASFRATSA